MWSESELLAKFNPKVLNNRRNDKMVKPEAIAAAARLQARKVDFWMGCASGG